MMGTHTEALHPPDSPPPDTPTPDVPTLECSPPVPTPTDTLPPDTPVDDASPLRALTHPLVHRKEAVAQCCPLITHSHTVK